MSHATLRSLIRKSLPVVSKAVNDLMAEGLVVEQGYAPSSGGRRPVVYSLTPDGMFILSVAMDQLSTRMVLVDMLNRTSEARRVGNECVRTSSSRVSPSY